MENTTRKHVQRLRATESQTQMLCSVLILTVKKCRVRAWSPTLCHGMWQNDNGLMRLYCHDGTRWWWCSTTKTTSSSCVVGGKHLSNVDFLQFSCKVPLATSDASSEGSKGFTACKNFPIARHYRLHRFGDERWDKDVVFRIRKPTLSKQ